MIARPRRAGSAFSNIGLWRLMLRARDILLWGGVSEWMDGMMSWGCLGEGVGVGDGYV